MEEHIMANLMYALFQTNTPQLRQLAFKMMALYSNKVPKLKAIIDKTQYIIDNYAELTASPYLHSPIQTNSAVKLPVTEAPLVQLLKGFQLALKQKSIASTEGVVYSLGLHNWYISFLDEVVELAEVMYTKILAHRMNRCFYNFIQKAMYQLCNPRLYTTPSLQSLKVVHDGPEDVDRLFKYTSLDRRV
ncbi:hypothetical protein BT96DRAFT_1083201 [Gymnopus androsaceus JB14]|uniref:Uncharacterized protein n=1 Tax=Gymnopus androsaceus JB14 TaxID=1447944 RepID=A0A6A4I0P6_9AGAR|nr:hypothetical protein BT96DRAFT_1083201 [Gymnopus androsaceus JB14]